MLGGVLSDLEPLLHPPLCPAPPFRSAYTLVKVSCECVERTQLQCAKARARSSSRVVDVDVVVGGIPGSLEHQQQSHLRRVSRLSMLKSCEEIDKYIQKWK